jgi:hypothetical protein
MDMNKAALAVIGTAMITSTAFAPAEARWRHHRHGGGVDAGDVVAGVAIVGGIAAIASAIGEKKRAKQDDAVDTCAQEAEYRSRGELSEVTHVSKRKGYYTVEGLLDADSIDPTSFSCTVRNGRIYSMRLDRDEV